MKTLLFFFVFATSAHCYSQVADKVKSPSEVPANDTTLVAIAKETIPPLELRRMKYITWVFIVNGDVSQEIPYTKEQRLEFRKMLKESIHNRDIYAD
jgi:hypothetical protein